MRGIIPAYAGLTGGHRTGVCVHRDHPRLRGVNFVEPAIRMTADGSSPLTRG